MIQLIFPIEAAEEARHISHYHPFVVRGCPVVPQMHMATDLSDISKMEGTMLVYTILINALWTLAES